MGKQKQRPKARDITTECLRGPPTTTAPDTTVLTPAAQPTTKPSALEVLKGTAPAQKPIAPTGMDFPAVPAADPQPVQHGPSDNVPTRNGEAPRPKPKREAPVEAPVRSADDVPPQTHHRGAPMAGAGPASAKVIPMSVCSSPPSATPPPEVHRPSSTASNKQPPRCVAPVDDSDEEEAVATNFMQASHQDYHGQQNVQPTSNQQSIRVPWEQAGNSPITQQQQQSLTAVDQQQQQQVFSPVDALQRQPVMGASAAGGQVMPASISVTSGPSAMNLTMAQQAAMQPPVGAAFQQSPQPIAAYPATAVMQRVVPPGPLPTGTKLQIFMPDGQLLWQGMTDDPEIVPTAATTQAVLSGRKSVNLRLCTQWSKGNCRNEGQCTYAHIRSMRGVVQQMQQYQQQQAWMRQQQQAGRTSPPPMSQSAWMGAPAGVAAQTIAPTANMHPLRNVTVNNSVSTGPGEMAADGTRKGVLPYPAAPFDGRFDSMNGTEGAGFTQLQAQGPPASFRDHTLPAVDDASATLEAIIAGSAPPSRVTSAQSAPAGDMMPNNEGRSASEELMLNDINSTLMGILGGMAHNGKEPQQSNLSLPSNAGPPEQPPANSSTSSLPASQSALDDASVTPNTPPVPNGDEPGKIVDLMRLLTA